MALLSIKLLIFINKESLWNQKQPIYTLNYYIYHKIIEGTTFVEPLLTHVALKPLNFTFVMILAQTWLDSSDGGNISHDHKLRGHHQFYRTVWRMAQHQQPNWKIGLNKLNLCWNFSLTVRLTKFPVTSWLLRCHLAPSKDQLPGDRAGLFRLQPSLHSWSQIY